jgi:hypothetical protein
MMGRIPAAVSSGLLSETQAAAIRAVDIRLHSFSGEENAPLWHVEQLAEAQEWQDVRELARQALGTFNEPI